MVIKLAKFEPKGEKILHGAGQSLETFTNYWNAVGENKPLIYMTYIKMAKISNGIKKIKEEYKSFPNVILQIGLNILDLDKGDITGGVSKGEYDSDLKNLFQTFGKIKNPIFLRIGYEFDKKGKYNPKNFVRAWKHIVKIMKELNVKNVATVWCACPFNGTEPVESYYPGDGYVDWFGIDVFPKR